MNQATKIINEASYLLDCQKKELIKDLGLIENVNIFDTIDSVLFKLLGRSLTDLSPTEMQELKMVLQDIGYEIR